MILFMNQDLITVLTDLHGELAVVVPSDRTLAYAEEWSFPRRLIQGTPAWLSQPPTILYAAHRAKEKAANLNLSFILNVLTFVMMQLYAYA